MTTHNSINLILASGQEERPTFFFKSKLLNPEKNRSLHLTLYGSPASQSGAVLIVSLIMLLLLTLIGVTSSQVTSLEEKMAGNMRDKNLAFQAAESALREAEKSLPMPPAAFDAIGTDGLYSDASTIPTEAAITTDGFWTTNSVVTSTINDLGNNVTAPLYIIQKLPAACLTPPCSPGSAKPLYRITARATGGTTNAVVILQSTYG